MIRVSDALEAMVTGNPFLSFGLRHRLFNLTRLAAHLAPLVNARTHKEVSTAAVTMALSRMQSAARARRDAPERYVIERITIHSGLATATFAHGRHAHQRLNRLYARIQANGDFCSLAEGAREITIILSDRYFEPMLKAVDAKPLYTHQRLASVGVQFSERYADVPGVLYSLLQQVTLQNINLIEISSTYTEIAFFVDEQDTRTVFDTFYQTFLVREANDASAR